MMRVLFLSHCAPDAPDKGEKVRAHYTVRRLSRVHELHVVCFSRSDSEVEGLRKLERECASVYGAPLHPKAALLRSAMPFLAGGCLNRLYYLDVRLQRRIAELTADRQFDAAVVYTLPMAQYVPPGTPYLFDLQDVDSEKWFQYAQRRFPGFLYRMEAERLRRDEVKYARGARRTYLVTPSEEALFRDFAGDLPTGYIENGWDAAAHDPAGVAEWPELARQRRLVFVGTMSYYPNVEGAVWFANHIFPELRRRDPSLELSIVGRDPGRAVLALGSLPGITVTGAVPDPRPYLKHALVALAPLQLARGIQMKVIEALSMGKPVLVSPQVAKTFGGRVPLGVTVCEDAAAYWRGLQNCNAWTPAEIRAAALERFDGYRNLEVLESELAAIGAASLVRP
jgi:sugar transferase (PEP-CTERM/EpsH1 system associated)